MPRKPEVSNPLSRILHRQRAGPVGMDVPKPGATHYLTPGTMGRLDFSQLLADAGSTVRPVKAQKAAGSRVDAAFVFKGVENVDRADRKPFNGQFDWLSTFTTEKFALVPEPIESADSAIRAGMCKLLSESSLATEIFTKISEPSKRDRTERLAWIFPDGRLADVKSGSIQEVTVSAPPDRAVGLLHSHVIMSSFISPPSVGRGNNDYEADSLRKYSMQFVVESDSRRIWGQFQGARTSILGRLAAPTGRFDMIDVDDPVGRTVYVTVPLDTWNQKQDELSRQKDDADRESLRKKLMEQQRPR
jgi:hypothetical protein